MIMTKYQPITFDEPWQAVKFINEGGKLYQLDCGHAYEVDAQVAMGNYNATGPSQLYTIAKPAEWWEKLDGTIENGVLCWVSDDYEEPNVIEIVTAIDDNWHVTSSGSWYNATPLTSAEILALLKNAPDYDGGADD
jgi:subtilase family serine protease